MDFKINTKAFIIFCFCLLTFISVGVAQVKTGLPFEIKKEEPAIGLTLGWTLPESQLQKIVGDKFKPIVKDGKGFLMLFMATAPVYYLEGKAYKDLQQAHIVIPVEGEHCINAPKTIVPKKQLLNQSLKKHHFKLEIGIIEMSLTYTNDSIHLRAALKTAQGSIEFHSSFANAPGELKKFEATTIYATRDPNHYFKGPESYVPIQIPTIEIHSSGKNWLTELELTAPPDRIWLNTQCCWNFVFNNP